ncbi:MULTISPECIES: alpha/beta fold hydrolase [Pseudomonas]|uniref:alpha/beta fold hydrolase n=1 Tax=Pseudomonas TaxID=286 RepID=UPI000731B58B|nr:MULTISPECIES: alpha/beta fold hydrolase [Pseudomonas]KTC02999.1 2-succinyl-6-hydroxy-2,4-cyclohexadiene-1-carboxylate synthase [Pseudomonas sp. ICMP 10191]PBP32655.1 2-succinyl-6-hydroxy-2,4-cyclohexadiene-1-carboxylate synthase [Pseudomonas syringae]
MPDLLIDGKTLHYSDQGTGPVVVLGHSYLWDKAMWSAQIDTLASQYRVIVPDLWGHGDSSGFPEGTRNLDDLARHALALLDHLNIERCSIVGLSVGGMWGAIAALLAPERITGLVLMDTYLGKETEAKKAYYFSLLDKLEEVGTFPEPLLDIVVPIFFRPGIDPQSPVYTSFRAALAGMNTEQLRQSVVPLGRMIFGRDDRLGLIEQLNADTTLVMCGDADIPRPPEETCEMASLIGCPYVLVPEAGHIASLENPDFVSGALMTFLARVNQKQG